MNYRILIVLFAALAFGCSESTDPIENVDNSITKADAEKLSGKSDSGVDLCGYFGWYDDGICDTFCPKPDPDCGSYFDAAGYMELEYNVQPRYCIEDGQLLEATIAREASGDLTISGVVSIEDDSNPDACIDTANSDCLVESAFGPAPLTPSQATELERLLSAVPAPMCEVSTELACDPCTVETLEVDDVLANGFCCGTTAAGFTDAFRDVIDYLETLVPEAPAPGDFFDAAGYQKLDYQALWGVGFCIDDGQILEATIEREAGGDLVMTGVESVADDSNPNACISDVINPDHSCLVESAFGPTTLTASQATELEGLLSAVPAPMCEVAQGLVCDYCIVETLDVDSVVADGSCCGTPAAGFSEAFRDVVDYLQTIK